MQCFLFILSIRRRHTRCALVTGVQTCARPISTPNIVNVVSRSFNFEVTIADLARGSERRAWWVAFGAILMALILAGGYFLMLPLKEKVPRSEERRWGKRVTVRVDPGGRRSITTTIHTQ